MSVCRTKRLTTSKLQTMGPLHVGVQNKSTRFKKFKFNILGDGAWIDLALVYIPILIELRQFNTHNPLYQISETHSNEILKTLWKKKLYLIIYFYSLTLQSRYKKIHNFANYNYCYPILFNIAISIVGIGIKCRLLHV